MLKMKIILLILLIFKSLIIFSQTDDDNKFAEPLQEFFVAGAVYAQENNEIQITATDSYYKNNIYKINSPALEIEYGITDKLQIGIGGNFSTFYPEIGQKYGSYGTEIGMLYNFINNQSFAISGVFETNLSFTNSIYLENEIEYEPQIIFAKQLGKTQLHTGIGTGIGEETEINYDFAFLYPYKIICTSLEINGLVYQKQNFLMLTPGITLKPTDLFEIGIGIPFGLTKNNSIFGLIFGITFEFEN